MKVAVFPYLAVALGILLMMVVIQGSIAGVEGETAIPLLTLLVISEFAFFVTAIGVYIGIKHFRSVTRRPVYIGATIICAVLATGFLWLGFKLWPL